MSQDAAKNQDDTSAGSKTATLGAPCPACGAELSRKADTCWRCGGLLVAPEFAEHDDNPYAVTPGAHVVPTYSLASLMLIVTLVAVGLGIFVSAPGLGVLFLIAAVPALVRTVIHVNNRRRLGKEIEPSTKLNIFAASIGVSVAAATAAVAAFFSTCLVSCGVIAAASNGLNNVNEAFVYLAMLVAGVAAVASFCGVFYLFRARRKRVPFPFSGEYGPKDHATAPPQDRPDAEFKDRS